MCVRITRMDNVDVGLFDRDWNNAIYFFVLNADEQIYLRYGGRDSQSADTYINLKAWNWRCEQGLELHQQYLAGELKARAAPQAAVPARNSAAGRAHLRPQQCVECHLIGDFQNIQREQDGTLDKLTHLYRSPDIKTIGIYLDVPKGLVVKEAKARSRPRA